MDLISGCGASSVPFCIRWRHNKLRKKSRNAIMTNTVHSAWSRASKSALECCPALPRRRTKRKAHYKMTRPSKHNDMVLNWHYSNLNGTCMASRSIRVPHWIFPALLVCDGNWGLRSVQILRWPHLIRRTPAPELEVKHFAFMDDRSFFCRQLLYLVWPTPSLLSGWAG